MANVLIGVEGRAARATGSVYLFLFPIPVVCFIGALATDMVYASSEFIMWLNVSQWLIAAGVAFGILAGIVLLVELITNRALRGAAVGWAHVALFYVGLIVEIFNAFEHTADGYTAVVPLGMTLSVIGAVLMFLAAVMLMRVPARSIEVRRF